MTNLPSFQPGLPDGSVGEDPHVMALAWQGLVFRADATAADWERYAVWLDHSPAHRHAADDIALLDADLNALPGNQAAVHADPKIVRLDAVLEARRGRLITPRRLVLAAMAVAAALGTILIAPQLLPEKLVSQHYATATGESKVVVLPDGSQLALNTATKVTVRFARSVRSVELTTGEASFNVTKDANRPFVIALGDSSVRVVGTEFNILRDAGKLSVTVRRGIVELASAGQDPHHAWSDSVRLTPGKQLEHIQGSLTSTVRDLDANEAYAWQNRQLVYHDRALNEVVHDLNRYFTVPVRVASSKTGSLRFSGVLILDKEEIVLHRLEKFLPINVTSSATEFVLHAREFQKQ
jgi:transmembrane sensor